MGSHENIFDNGANAFRSGVPQSGNPYEVSSINYLRWNTGWEDARQSANTFAGWAKAA